jgi:hypothetical protein
MSAQHGFGRRPTRREPLELVPWRVRRLVAAGFTHLDAARLARRRDIDFHALLELIDRGCPPELAARITAPL